MQQQIDIHTLSIIELKAYAFDLQALIGQSQNNLKIIVQELENRAKTSDVSQAAS